ncbi:MAG: hypothetical protein R3288_16450, partial [Woeseiaceae bacterium]|nr:hypothetical protein [Woeseiaceae bacterium]
MPRLDGSRRAPALRLAATSMLLAASPQGLAEDSTTDESLIDQIVVVAHKNERSIREVAANVTVVSRATLRDQLVSTLDEVFRYVPGIDYEAAGSRFGTEGIN